MVFGGEIEDGLADDDSVCFICFVQMTGHENLTNSSLVSFLEVLVRQLKTETPDFKVVEEVFIIITGYFEVCHILSIDYTVLMTSMSIGFLFCFVL